MKRYITTVGFIMGRRSYRRNDPFDPRDHDPTQVEIQIRRGVIKELPSSEPLPHVPPLGGDKPTEMLPKFADEGIKHYEEEVVKPKKKAGRPKKED